MSNKKFEKLIEYVINDEEDKARELFHQIVVEKSREIYEGLMDDDEFGGADDDSFIDDIQSDVEADEDGIEAEDEFGDAEFGDDDGADDTEFAASDDFGSDDEAGEDLEDRLVDVEDKLDELIAEFEALSGEDEDFGGDDFAAADDTAATDDFGSDDEDFGSDDEDFGAEGDDEENQFGESISENVSLTAVPKPANTDQADNKKSVSRQNSGKAGVGTGGNPVKFSSGAAETGRKAPGTKDIGVNGPEAAAKGAFKSKAPAPKVNESRNRNKR